MKKALPIVIGVGVVILLFAFISNAQRAYRITAEATDMSGSAPQSASVFLGF